ncbi:MAG: lysophospholipase L1-like esterase [Polaribacter sp.]|jgi:lysophospholipase L1-like esterase
MNLKYLLGLTLSMPLLPIMYFQGKKIRSSVPKLDEATGISGTTGQHSTRVLRMVTIGESTVAGVGVATHEEGFTGTLAKTLAEELDATIEWKVYAKSGYTAKRVTYKIIPKIEETDLDLIVIGLGGNDAFKLNSPGLWRSQMQTLIETLQVKFPKAPICFMNMPPIKEFPAFTSLIKFTVGNLVELLGAELEAVVQARKNVFYASEVITLDFWIKQLQTNKRPADFFSDGVHPSKFTYQVWGKYFGEYLLYDKEIRSILNQKITTA